jgi:S1-C subfamily serine protease
MNMLRNVLSALIILGLNCVPISYAQEEKRSSDNPPSKFDCRGKSLIGIKMEDVLTPKGVRVSKIWSGKPADRAGIKTGDIIVNVGGIDTSDHTILYALVQKLPADVPADFLVVRNGEKIKISVIPASACRILGKE